MDEIEHHTWNSKDSCEEVKLTTRKRDLKAQHKTATMVDKVPIPAAEESKRQSK